MDILQATLASGIRVVKFVPSYGDQPNDITHVTKCTFVARFFGGRCGAVMLTDCMRARVCRLQGQVPWIPRTCFCLYARASMGAPATASDRIDGSFLCLQKRLSPKARPFYWHETSVIVRSSLSSPCARTLACD